MRLRGKQVGARAVVDDRDPLRRYAASSEALGERLVHGDDRVGEAEGQHLLELEQPHREGIRRPREAAAKELRHRLVQVEHDGDAGELQRERGEHEEVRDGVHLHDRETAMPVGADRGQRRASEESEVLDDVQAQGCALVALDIEALDVHAPHLPGRRVSRPPEREDLDPSASGDERLRLATNPWILVVVRVRDHQDRAACDGAFGGPVYREPFPRAASVPRERLPSWTPTPI